jgi:membrane-associated protease RseP (regulator of RpoE activity)
MHLSITACLVSVLLHELGHIVMAKALGVRVKRAGISWKGPYIVREMGTPAQNMCISLAGPTMNALLLFVPGLFLVNLAVLVPNLVLTDSDGRRAWKCWQAIASSKGSNPPE